MTTTPPPLPDASGGLDAAAQRLLHRFQHPLAEGGLAQAWAVVVFGAFGGYMLTAVPNRVLVLWELFPFQFLTVFVTFAIDNLASSTPSSWLSVILDALLVSIFIQLFVRGTNYLYGDKPGEMFPIYKMLSHDATKDSPFQIFTTPDSQAEEDDCEEKFEPRKECSKC